MLSSKASDLLTVAQVAQMYHVRESTVRARISKGLLPARKMVGGKNWLVERADAETMLDAHSSPPADQPHGALPSPPGSASIPANAPSPLIDRLGTPEGRARAIAFLRALREEDEDGAQEAAWDVLKDGVTPLSLRRWSPQDAEADEEPDGGAA